MAKSIPAIVTPEVLKWARELDKISEFEIADKIKVDVAKIRNWEAGDEYPSLTQAKKLAKQYRVPFAKKLQFQCNKLIDVCGNSTFCGETFNFVHNFDRLYIKL